MIRRTLVAVSLLTLLMVGLTACFWTPVPKDFASVVPAPEGVVPLSAGEMVPSPPPVANSIIPVSIPVDTTNFSRPATVNGWELSDDLSYVVVTIRLSKDAWVSLAEQAGFDETVDPFRVQLDEETARSLIDIDQLAGEVIQQRESRDETPVDIRAIEAHYGVVVSGQ